MLSGADIERIKEALSESDGNVSSYVTELTISGTDSSFASNHQVLYNIANNNAIKLSVDNKVDLIKITLWSQFSEDVKRNIISKVLKDQDYSKISANLSLYELLLLVEMDNDDCFKCAIYGFNQYNDLYAVFTHPKSNALFRNTERIKQVIMRPRLGSYVMSTFPQKRILHDTVNQDSEFAIWFKTEMLEDITRQLYTVQGVNISINIQSIETYTYRYAHFLCIGQLYIPPNKTLIIRDIETKEELFQYKNSSVGQFVDINRVYFDKVEVVENYVFRPPSGQQMPVEKQGIYS